MLDEDGEPTRVYFWRPDAHPHLAHPRLIARPVRMPRGSGPLIAQPTPPPDFLEEAATTRLR
jgi:hypothetical protein